MNNFTNFIISSSLEDTLLQQNWSFPVGIISLVNILQIRWIWAVKSQKIKSFLHMRLALNKF